MPTPPSTKQILNQITKLENDLNGLKIIPATSSYRTSVLLAMLSKSLTVSRATCSLVNEGFPSEAFGLSRTLIDIYFSARFISNQDIEKRAKRFVDYGARVRREWQIIMRKYFPNTPPEEITLDEEVLQMADTFKNRGNWTGLPGQTKAMALEADPIEMDPEGLPYKSEFDYDVTYFWTSQYVHSTVIAVKDHACTPGTPFKVRAGNWASKRRGDRALFNVTVYTSKTFVCAFRAMNEGQPNSVHEMFKLTKRFAVKGRR
jgi:Family of unknown function (DUF5677)